jgi:hypothetical protein
MTKMLTFAAVLLAFGALFWIGPSLSVQQSGAPVPPRLDVTQIEREAPTNLPTFEDNYQRHYGVLDVLRP